MCQEPGRREDPTASLSRFFLFTPNTVSKSSKMHLPPPSVRILIVFAFFSLLDLKTEEKEATLILNNSAKQTANDQWKSSLIDKHFRCPLNLYLTYDTELNVGCCSL